MGEIYRIRCDKCSIDNQLYLGNGMRDYSIENVLGAFDEEELDFKAVIKMANEGTWVYKRSIAYCGNCKKYYAAPVLAIKHNNEKYGYVGKCSCNEHGSLKRFSAGCPCDACGGKLSATFIGMWD